MTDEDDEPVDDESVVVETDGFGDFDPMQMHERLVRVEEGQDHISKTLDDIQKDIGKIEGTMVKEGELEKLETRVSDNEEQVESHYIVYRGIRLAAWGVSVIVGSGLVVYLFP